MLSCKNSLWYDVDNEYSVYKVGEYLTTSANLRAFSVNKNSFTNAIM